MASDGFNRANENPIASPWATYGFTALAIDTNAAVASAPGNDCGGIYTGAASTADQYAEMNNWDTDASGLGGPVVRAFDAKNHYCHEVDATFSGGNTRRNKFVANAFTQLADSGTLIPATGGVPIRIEVEGTTIRTYVNGVATANSPLTDTSLTTGQPGLFNYRTTRPVSDWSGGDLNVTTPIAPKQGQPRFN